MNVRPLLAAALLGVALAPSARADATLDYVDAGNGAPQGRLFVGAGKLRIDIAYAPGHHYVVVDPSARTLTQINPQTRTLATATAEQAQQLIAGIDGAADPAAQPLLQLALGGLDAEQRAQAEALLRQSRREAAIPYAKTGARERVAGIACDVYTQKLDSGEPRSLCLAHYADLGLDTADARTLQAAIELLRQTGGPWLPLARLPGLPLRYAGSFGDPAYAGAGRLRAISRQPLSAAVFADPPAYRIISLFEMLALLGAR